MVLQAVTIGRTFMTEEARIRQYGRSWDAYNGKFPNPIKIEPDGVNDNVIVNRIGPIVGANVSLLFSPPPDFELPKDEDDEDSATRSDDEQWLDSVLRANNWPATLLKFGTNGAVCGTAYFRLVPAMPYPRIQVMDPAGMTVKWDPADIDTTTGYIWSFNSFSKETKPRPIVQRQVVELQDNGSWLILDQWAYTDGYNWNNIGTPTVWPYSFPPYLHCQNLPAPNEVYGLADVTENLIRLNRQLNFNLSNRRKIDRLHGAPIPYATGIDGQRVNYAPGVLLGLPEGSQAGMLTPSINSEGAASLGNDIDASILAESGTPGLLLGLVDDTSLPPSGIALRIRLLPATNRRATKITMYEPALVELFRRLLIIGGRIEPPADVVATIKWVDPLPVDSLQQRQVWVIDDNLGIVSKQTLSQKAGYDWEYEQENMKEEEGSEGEKALSDAINAPGMNMPPSPLVNQQPTMMPPGQPMNGGNAIG